MVNMVMIVWSLGGCLSNDGSIECFVGFFGGGRNCFCCFVGYIWD